MTKAEETERWLWPRYNPQGLLVGPLPFKGNAPDYSHPGVAERVRIEIDFYMEQERYRE